MTLKDLSAFLTPSLKLPWHDHVFEVSPPSKEDGLLMAALNAAGIAQYMNSTEPCERCGRSAESHEISEEFQGLIEAAQNRDLGEISLGAAFAEMRAAGVPGPDIDMFAVYALYYWSMGEETADAILAARHGAGKGDTTDPKASPRKRSKSGPSSG